MFKIQSLAEVVIINATWIILFCYKYFISHLGIVLTVFIELLALITAYYIYRRRYYELKKNRPELWAVFEERKAKKEGEDHE